MAILVGGGLQFVHAAGRGVDRASKPGGRCFGEVERYWQYDQPWYHIKYTDGDEEDVSRETALKLIRKYKNDEEPAS